MQQFSGARGQRCHAGKLPLDRLRSIARALMAGLRPEPVGFDGFPDIACEIAEHRNVADDEERAGGLADDDGFEAVLALQACTVAAEGDDVGVVVVPAAVGHVACAGGVQPA
ncbi:hypothetical protein [Kitasatospora sp. Ki12]